MCVYLSKHSLLVDVDILPLISFFCNPYDEQFCLSCLKTPVHSSVKGIAKGMNDQERYFLPVLTPIQQTLSTANETMSTCQDPTGA